MVLYTENKAGENVIKFQDENKQTHSIKVNSNFSLFVQYKADFSLILDPSPFNFWCFLAKSFFSHLPPIFRVLYSNSWPFLRANICRYRLLCPSVVAEHHRVIKVSLRDLCLFWFCTETMFLFSFCTAGHWRARSRDLTYDERQYGIKSKQKQLSEKRDKNRVV